METSSTPLCLTHLDLILRYTWIGQTLGFAYRIDVVRLKEALRKVLHQFSSLAGIHQDPEGRYCIGLRTDKKVALTSTDHFNFKLADFPSTFVRPHVPDGLPNNDLARDFLEQMQPHLILAGEEALFKLRLTQLSDGCVLGISFSHMLAGDCADAQAAIRMHASLCAYYRMHTTRTIYANAQEPLCVYSSCNQLGLK